MDLKACIRNIPDFPKPGIIFRDITTLLGNPAALAYTIDTMATQVRDLQPQYIVGMESRGFIFGAALAYKLGIGFIPVRKPGKLPGEIQAIEYTLEYGTDRLEPIKSCRNSPSRKSSRINSAKPNSASTRKSKSTFAKRRCANCSCACRAATRSRDSTLPD